MERTTPHNALIFTMIAMTCADNKIAESEIERISEIVSHVPVFRDYDQQKLDEATEACAKILGEDDGLATLLDIIAASLPKKLYETAYVLALEVAAADLRVPVEEIRLLELLAEALHLDKLVVSALERSVRARHQTI